MVNVPTFIVVRYGLSGEQLAFHMGVNVVGKAKVRKYRKNGRRWTQIVTVEPREILREATDRDMKKFGVSRDAKLD